MGKATRWLKGLFSTRKNKCAFSTNSSNMARKELGFAASTAGYVFFDGEVELREEEDNRRAIAMAAATAAVAEAAVAAAQAAAEVVRFANSGRASSHVSVGGMRIREVLAAVRIQSAFRGCLVRFLDFFFFLLKASN